MAEYGEWVRKGATLSDVTAKTEYGVTRLKRVKKEISELKKKLTALQDKKTQLEEFLSK